MTSLALLTALIMSVSVPARGAAQHVDRKTRQSIAAELFFPTDVDNRNIRVTALSAETERYLMGGLFLRGVGGLVFAEGFYLEDQGPRSVQFDANAVGVGIGGFLRWRPVSIGRLGPFVEGGLGMLFTTEQFPPSGTVWNFSPKYGLGLDIRITSRLSLAAAYRHVHYSNGKGYGHPRNPSYDGDGMMLAVTF